jgi:two-component system chemotaxis sensor kinase CheA
LIDEAMLERIGDQEAINLIFAAGLSTAEVVSDLSGRGVGMDVVRSAVEKINGSVQIESEVGKGTTDPHLAAAFDGRYPGYGHRVRRPTVWCAHGKCSRDCSNSEKRHSCIKQSQAAVLRGRIVPLKASERSAGNCGCPSAEFGR